MMDDHVSQNQDQKSLEDRITEEQKLVQGEVATRLEAIQQLLNRDRAELQSLDGRILASKERLQIIVREQKQIKAENSSMIADRGLIISELKVKIDELKIDAKHKTARVKDEQDKVNNLKLQLRQLKDQIRDRRAYLNEQEEIISTSIATGNEELLTLNSEADKCKRDKEDLLRDIIILEENKRVATRNSETVISQTRQLEHKYQETAATLRTRLEELQDQISQAAIEHHSIKVQSERQLDEIKTKQEELDLKSKELVDKEKDLAKRELRYQSARQIYNV